MPQSLPTPLFSQGMRVVPPPDKQQQVLGVIADELSFTKLANDNFGAVG